MNTKLLCKFKGGSHAYGLSTPTSDVDWRGVFINTEVKHLVGLSRHDHQLKQNDTTDESYKEFRHALQLLRNANSEMVEMLYLRPNQLEVCTPEWAMVLRHRKDLVSSEKLFNCLRGYMQGELRLANGERTGKLGGKRQASIADHGFSEKNIVQYFRLAMAGRVYFQKGYFPVNISDENPKYAEWLMMIKTSPRSVDVTYLNQEAKKAEEALVLDYESRKYATQFDEDLANELCLKVYGPLIQQAYSQLQLNSL
jgi:hypothetical protein